MKTVLFVRQVEYLNEQLRVLTKMSLHITRLLFRIKEFHHPLFFPVKFSVSNLVNDNKLKTALADLIAADITNLSYSIGRLSERSAKDRITTQQQCQTLLISVLPLSSLLHPKLGLIYYASEVKLMLMPYQGKYDLAVIL